MKLTKQQLRRLIQEELNYILEEQEVDENFLKKALAGAAIAGGLMGATPAYANKPVATPASQSDVKILEDYNTKEYSTELGYDDAYSQALEEAKIYFQKKYSGKDFQIKVIKENIKGSEAEPTAVSLIVRAFQ